MAWRMIRSRSGRLLNVTSIAAIFGIWLGVMALIIATSLMTGFQTDLKVKMLGGVAHITAYPVLHDPPRSLEDILGTLRANPNITSAYPVVYSQLLLSGPAGNAGVLVKGIPLNARKQILVLNRVIDGDWKDFSEEGGIAIGTGLAEQLGVAAGDRITVLVPDGLVSPLGIMPRRRITRVSVIFQSDLYEFDNNWAFLPFRVAQHWMRINNEYSAIEILLRNVDKADEIARGLSKEFRSAGLIFETWMNQNRALFSALILEKWMLFAAITLIVVVASFNIVTHLALMVREKRSRIALLLAMGAQPKAILNLFLWQGVILGFIGTLGGMLTGLSASWILDHYHLIRLPVEVYFIPYLPFRPQFVDVCIIAFTAFFICVLASWTPARQASRLRPASILRSP